MELTIKIEDKKRYDSFVQFFRTLGVKIVSLTTAERAVEKHHDSKTNIKSKSGLDDVFGIWKGRNITVEKIRNEQWEKRAG